MNWNTVLRDRLERFTGRDEQDSVKGYATKQFGPNLGPLFYDLWIQLDAIESAFGIYVSLFVSQNNREILRKNSAIFWDYISRFASDYLLMSLTRITESPRGKSRVTIRRLPHCFEDDSQKKEMESYVNRIVRETSSIREYRDKLIAHRDKGVHIDGNELPPVTLESIENCIGLLKDLLRKLSNDDTWIDDREREHAYKTGDRFVHQLRYLTWVNENYENNQNEGIPMPPKKEYR